MSVLTDVVIVTRFDDDGAIRRVNAAVADQARGQQLERIGSDADFGGSKVPSCAVYGACYNFLDLAGFTDALTSAGWERPQYVVAWIDAETDDDLIVWRPQ